jgi:hypothetical protein
MIKEAIYQKATFYQDIIQTKGIKILGKMDQPLQQLDSLRHLGEAYLHQNMETAQNAITVTGDVLTNTANVLPQLYNATVEFPSRLSEVSPLASEPGTLESLFLQGCLGSIGIYIVGWLALRKLGKHLRRND